MLTWSVILLVSLIFVIYNFLWINFKPGQPPGPWKLPFFGSIHVFLKNLNTVKIGAEIYTKLSEQYGPIFNLKVGMLNSYVVPDFELQKEGMASEDLLNRHQHIFLLDAYDGKTKGIIWNTGDEWRHVRRYTLSIIKRFGFGKNASMDQHMESEFANLKKHLLTKFNGRTFADSSFQRMFSIATLNIVWSWMASHRFEIDDPKVHRLMDTVHNLSRCTSAASSFFLVFPFLRHIFPSLLGKVLAENKKLMAFGHEIIQERRKSGAYLTEQNYFIDMFLLEIEKSKDSSNFNTWFYDEQLVVIISDMIFGGSETASLTLEFAVMALVLNPEVQRKMKQEVDAVVGNNRTPTWSDSRSMPYCLAVVFEALRLANSIPNADRMNVFNDTKLGDYIIPKGSSVYFNVFGYHMNPKYWDEPLKFKPERFIDADGKLINTDKILSFGFGKRMCLGDIVGRATLFTFMTSLVQSFSLETSPGHDDLGKNWLKFDDGLVISTKGFTARLVLRVE